MRRREYKNTVLVLQFARDITKCLAEGFLRVRE